MILETCQRSLKGKQHVVYQIYKQLGRWCMKHVRKKNKLRFNIRKLLTF